VPGRSRKRARPMPGRSRNRARQFMSRWAGFESTLHAQSFPGRCNGAAGSRCSARRGPGGRARTDRRALTAHDFYAAITKSFAAARGSRSRWMLIEHGAMLKDWKQRWKMKHDSPSVVNAAAASAFISCECFRRDLRRPDLLSAGFPLSCIPAAKMFRKPRKVNRCINPARVRIALADAPLKSTQRCASVLVIVRRRLATSTLPSPICRRGP
jgi:hypothetical protein